MLGRGDLVGPQRMAYLLDLTRPEGLFSAREFIIRDEDTVYITEAPFAAWSRVLAGRDDRGQPRRLGRGDQPVAGRPAVQAAASRLPSNAALAAAMRGWLRRAKASSARIGSSSSRPRSVSS